MIKPRSNIIQCAAGFLALVALFAATTNSTQARTHYNKTVQITLEKKDSMGILYVTATNVLEATVRVDFDKLKNVKTSFPSPYEFVVDGPCEQKPILHVSSARRGPWQYHFDYRFKVGVKSNKPTSDFVYSLPYSRSKHFQVLQGAGGEFSHKKGGESANAVDFRMPLGTEICASRAGKVVAFRADSSMGGSTKKSGGLANYIVIQHDDGTYALYNHLKNDGVKVTLGQSVKVGTPIGWSGATGFVQEPCLHFSVYRVVSGAKSESVPFRMKTSRGIVQTLKEGETY